jgi:hypothetical protein
MADGTLNQNTDRDTWLRAASLRAPRGTFVTGEDQLRATILNGASGVTVAIRGRIESLDGRIVPFNESIVPATDRTASTRTIRLTEGWLLNASVVVSGGSPLTGQTFAMLSLIRGEGSAAIDLATLAAGSITAVQRLAYPGSPVANSLDGAGAIRTIVGTTPGAGLDINETVPAGARWDVLAFSYVLVTAVAVANRQSDLVFDDGTNIFYISRAQATIPASTTKTYRRSQGYGAAFADLNGDFNHSMPFGLTVAAGYRIRTSTSGIQAADQYAAPVYVVRERIEGA